MQDLVANYLRSISSKFSYEETSEMGYRTDFEMLLKGIFESINVKRIDQDPKARLGNKPDFVVLKHNIPILYVETKDIGISLDKVEKSDQMVRYYGYSNLVLTDYLEFRFYRNGLRYEDPIVIGEFNLKKRTIEPTVENYEYLTKTLADFAQSHKEPIRSGKHLAKIMGGKAQRIRDNIRQYFSLNRDEDSQLPLLFETIKKLLVHDLTKDSFADLYAQTLVYGLFVARYYDKSAGDFSRQEARELIPNSNPLLRHFFDHIVGADFDSRLRHIIDELCEVFSYANVADLLKEYFQTDLWGNEDKGKDPVIHFYEDFLREYDPELRKKMGAYYTPLPVVEFIVRSVDDVLKKEFGIVAGIADTSKIANGLHRVQVLDPAVGTGTFISVVIRKIYSRLVEKGQKGAWPGYVHNDLLPRLHAFELMMAPYTIAHLKLGIAFRQTGFWDFHRRLGIYLTNSLEESTRQQEMFAFGLAESIAKESKEASVIKNETPIMIVIGNPPYSKVSSNETEYANSLVGKYKFEPGGKIKLQERKHWLNDDYVKFIALAESLIEKNKEGILGFITNNGYLDNPTFRGMRWHLMKTFDSIYILDLHGSSKKREKSPDGKDDENVFNIQQGVGIMIAIKTGKKRPNELAEIYHAELFGKRDFKFEQLGRKQKWQKLNIDKKMFFFTNKNVAGKEIYEMGFSINDLFIKNSTGIVTMGDNFIIDFVKTSLRKKLEDFLDDNVSEDYFKMKYDLGKNYAKWIIQNKSIISEDQKKIIPIAYRPFDNRYTYFDNKLVWRPRTNIMRNFTIGENIGLVTARSNKNPLPDHFFISKTVTEAKLGESSTQSSIFPLYLYEEDGIRVPNFRKEIVDRLEKSIGKVSPEDILDYIYAILYSPSYRKKYKEFLKIDFPRVPYPKDKRNFKKLVSFGSQLRLLHLLESPKVNKFITTYSITGSDTVDKISYHDKKVFINENQYFGNVPELAWSFYIGGYQPAQRWLKDRKGRVLTNEDIEHYQKIIVALVGTEGLMEEIDKINLTS